MGFNNPSWSWSELESTLSDRGRTPQAPRTGRDGRAPGSPSWNGGGDSPAWSRKRQPFEPPEDLVAAGAPTDVVPYAELHCHTNFSFLDGASHPEELAVEAARLGLEALAVTDHNGFYGVVRFAEAAKAVGLATVFGTEITLTARRDGSLLEHSVARSETRHADADRHRPRPRLARSRPGRHPPARARRRPDRVRPAVAAS